MAVETALQTYRNWIGGKWMDAASGETFDSVSPADSRMIVGRFQSSGAEDAEAAIEAAESAFPAWRATSPSKRAEVLYKAADALEANMERIAAELTREEGKVLDSSRQEVKRSAQTLRYYASEGLNVGGSVLPSDDAGVLLYTKRDPLGVVSVITPWNFPLSIPARKIAPALAAGNTVVFKPASDTPLVALRLAEAFAEAGLPPGVLNFVTGSAAKVGVSLVTHPAVRAVTFTGSTTAGESIRRAVRLPTRLQLELGGKNPLIVADDADLELAAELAVKGGFELTGQACTGTSRIIVMDAVHDAFVEQLTERTRALTVGDGMTPGTDLGPLANAVQLETVLAYVEIGKREGARLLCGGKRLRGDEFDYGYYVSPAVFTGVRPDSRLAREEIFGPVIAVLRAKTFEEALMLANDTEYGLSASICTGSPARARMFVDNAEAGVIKVNRPTTGNAYNAPFGGIKLSGTGTFRESGRSAIDFYVQEKTVYRGL